MASAGEPSLWMRSHTTYTPGTGRVLHAMGGLGIVKDQNNQNLFFHLAGLQPPVAVHQLHGTRRLHWQLNG